MIEFDFSNSIAKEGEGVTNMCIPISQSNDGLKKSSALTVSRNCIDA